MSSLDKKQLDALERVLDKVFAKIGMDIEFTRHFFDRVNDPRNKDQITVKELAMLFKKEFIKYGKPISKLPKGSEAVMTDMASDINIPFVLKWDENKKELELVAKTVMRKPNFKTPDKKYTVEEIGNTTASAGIPTDTKNMGPRFKAVNVTDKRRRKDKHPVILKRFRSYLDDQK